MPRIAKWTNILSIIVLKKLAFWLIEAKRKQESKLDTDWQRKLSKLQVIGCACSLPDHEKHVYSNVSIMFPHLSKRQIYSIIDCRKRLDSVSLRTRQWQLILQKMDLE